MLNVQQCSNPNDVQWLRMLLLPLPSQLWMYRALTGTRQLAWQPQTPKVHRYLVAITLNLTLGFFVLRSLRFAGYRHVMPGCSTAAGAKVLERSIERSMNLKASCLAGAFSLVTRPVNLIEIPCIYIIRGVIPHQRQYPRLSKRDLHLRASVTLRTHEPSQDCKQSLLRSAVGMKTRGPKVISLK